MKRRVATIVAGACILGAVVSPTAAAAEPTSESQEGAPMATQVTWPRFDPSVVRIQCLYGPDPGPDPAVEELMDEVGEIVREAESKDQSQYTPESYAAMQEALDRTRPLLETDASKLKRSERNDLYTALEESREKLNEAISNLDVVPTPFWQRDVFLVPVIIMSAVIALIIVAIVVTKVVA